MSDRHLRCHTYTHSQTSAFQWKCVCPLVAALLTGSFKGGYQSFQPVRTREDLPAMLNLAPPTQWYPPAAGIQSLAITRMSLLEYSTHRYRQTGRNCSRWGQHLHCLHWPCADMRRLWLTTWTPPRAELQTHVLLSSKYTVHGRIVLQWGVWGGTDHLYIEHRHTHVRGKMKWTFVGQL